MTNTKSKIEIHTVEATKSITGTVLIIKGYPEENRGGGNLINETKEENTIYDASIVYEF
jgi:hypothetical protein